MSNINQKFCFKKNKNYICRELPEGHAIYSLSFSFFFFFCSVLCFYFFTIHLFLLVGV